MSNILQLDSVNDANGRSGISASLAPHGRNVEQAPSRTPCGLEPPNPGQSSRYGSIVEWLSGLDGADLLAPLIAREFPRRIAVISSFGAESAVLLHMVAQIDRSVPVISLDTEKLFAETIAYRAQLIERLGFTDVRIIKPDAGSVQLLDPEESLHRRSPDLCCRIRKIEPLQRALEGFSAWISGRKRFHGGSRLDIPTLEALDGRLKIEPLARFSADDIEAYLARYDLPRHPLVAQGYRSIGCAPCTIRGGTSDNPRAGRWAGLAKTECGIHWLLNGNPIRALDGLISPAEAAPLPRIEIAHLSNETVPRNLIVAGTPGIVD
jgi:phosphoadenosine phosphosulfate reductase